MHLHSSLGLINQRSGGSICLPAAAAAAGAKLAVIYDNGVTQFSTGKVGACKNFTVDNDS